MERREPPDWATLREPGVGAGLGKIPESNREDSPHSAAFLREARPLQLLPAQQPDKSLSAAPQPRAPPGVQGLGRQGGRTARPAPAGDAPGRAKALGSVRATAISGPRRPGGGPPEVRGRSRSWSLGAHAAGAHSVPQAPASSRFPDPVSRGPSQARVQSAPARGAPKSRGRALTSTSARPCRAPRAHRAGRREHSGARGCTLTPGGQTRLRTDAGAHPDLEGRLGSHGPPAGPRGPGRLGRSADRLTRGWLPGAGPGRSASRSSRPRTQPRPPARPPPRRRRSSRGRGLVPADRPGIPARGAPGPCSPPSVWSAPEDNPGPAPGREARVQELRARPEKQRSGRFGGSLMCSEGHRSKHPEKARGIALPLG